MDNPTSTTEGKGLKGLPAENSNLLSNDSSMNMTANTIPSELKGFADSKPLKKMEKIVELIEIDGKKVSKTATGKRKFHNKSKNGCDNCKRRRVKCDELKPCCQKCQKMKLHCVYTPAKPRKKKHRETEPIIKYVTTKLDEEEEDGGGDGHTQSEVTAAPTITDDQAIYAKASNPANPDIPCVSQDTTMLPSLFTGVNAQHLQQQLQQQPHLLPQLMTLTNSEKFAAFELPNSPAPLQAASMNVTNSISTFFSNSKITSSLLQQMALSPGQADLMSRNGFNLKQFGGSIPTAGIGGVTYDFQELFGIKSTNKDQEVPNQQRKHSVQQTESGAARNSQMDQSQHTVADPEPGQQQLPSVADAQLKIPLLQQSDDEQQKQQQLSSVQKHEEAINNASGVLNTLNADAGTPNLINNPTISPLAPPLSPMTKADVGLQQAGKANMSRASLGNTSTSVPSSIPVVGDGSHPKNAGASCSTGNSHVQPEDMNNSCCLHNFSKVIEFTNNTNLNLVDLKLFHHYCKNVWPTIISGGISEQHIWSDHIPELAFQYPFLMHALLAFSATHLSRSEAGLEPFVATHRLESLKLLREAVLQICEENTDALVASALILIMDSLANATTPSPGMPGGSMLPSAWIFHVKGAATILTAVWPLTKKSKFYNLINVDLSDLGDILNNENGTISELVCFDDTIADLYPVEIDSPYLITLAYLDKLHREKDRSGFILRVFAFPALLDKTFLALLMTGDHGAIRIMRSYYKLLRGYASEVKDRVWFLEGMTQVLPQDVDEYNGGGMHMMLDFLGGGLPSMTTTNFTEFV